MKITLTEAQSAAVDPLEQALHGQIVYVVDATGEVSKWAWTNSEMDLEMLRQGAAFTTEQEALDHARENKIHTKLRRLAKASGEIGSIWWWHCIGSCGDIICSTSACRSYMTRFATKEAAEHAIEIIGDEDMRWYLERG